MRPSISVYSVFWRPSVGFIASSVYAFSDLRYEITSGFDFSRSQK